MTLTRRRSKVESKLIEIIVNNVDKLKDICSDDGNDNMCVYSEHGGRYCHLDKVFNRMRNEYPKYFDFIRDKDIYIVIPDGVFKGWILYNERYENMCFRGFRIILHKYKYNDITVGVLAIMFIFIVLAFRLYQ